MLRADSRAAALIRAKRARAMVHRTGGMLLDKEVSRKRCSIDGLECCDKPWMNVEKTAGDSVDRGTTVVDAAFTNCPSGKDPPELQARALTGRDRSLEWQPRPATSCVYCPASPVPAGYVGTLKRYLNTYLVHLANLETARPYLFEEATRHDQRVFGLQQPRPAPADEILHPTRAS